MQSDYPQFRPPESAEPPETPTVSETSEVPESPTVNDSSALPGSPEVLGPRQFQEIPRIDEAPQVPEEPQVPEGPKIREVALVSGETVTHVFLPEAGLVPEPPQEGRTLVMTNRRIIAFCQNEGTRETVLVPMEEIKSVAVVGGHRNASMLVQGSLMVVAGLFIYMVLAYWLAGRFEGPTVPVLNMDLAPVIALLIILSGIGLIAQVYFAKPDGTVTFQGDGVQFTFPFRGEIAERQAYDIVNAAFALRESRRHRESGHDGEPGHDREPELEDPGECF